MNKDTNCPYCMEGDLVEKFGIKICELEVSKLYLFKEQSHEGRVIVAYKEHVGEMIELSEEKRNAFFKDVDIVAKALHAAFHPDKVNYGAYGDTGKHLHFHLVPKYKDATEWGSVFAMNPDQIYFEEDKYKEVIDKIKEQLK